MTSHQLGYAVTLPNGEIDAAIAVGLAHPNHLEKRTVSRRERCQEPEERCQEPKTARWASRPRHVSFRGIMLPRGRGPGLDMSVWISPPTPRNADAVRDACRLCRSDLRLALAVPHAAEARRLARLFRRSRSGPS